LLDGVDIQPTQFYERLKTAEVMPKTSQATVAAFQKIFEPLVVEGRPILAILISTKLSGTVQSAELAKANFPHARIEIIDTESCAMALGFQVLAAARAAEQGKSFDEVAALARSAKQKTGVVLVVDTLEFLHRGGRIGGANRFLGTALSIKPLLELREGRIEPIERVRTKSKAVARLLDLLEQRIAGRGNLRLAVLHAAAEQEARDLLEVAAKRLNPIETVFSEVSPVVGAHIGPGTLGMCYSVEL
jgi:DegV family protein with EDD domain